MRLGVLFSGGKDSVYALWKAMEKEEVVCLISLLSQNQESYMFHTPNIGMTSLQAEAIGLPLIRMTTEGEKERELDDLRSAIELAKKEHDIQGIVTGAIESVYQATRVQTICNELDLWCFNPLWKKDQIELMNEIVEKRFHTIISGIFAYPLTEEWLGRMIDHEMIQELNELQLEYEINPSGEGGEIETTVLDAPFFRKKIVIHDFEIEAKRNSGILKIKKAYLEAKDENERRVTEEENGARYADDPVSNGIGKAPGVLSGDSKEVDGGHPMILVVDMNGKRDSLSYSEFVLPIVRVVRESGHDCRAIHILDLTPQLMQTVDAAILSGNPLIDHEHVQGFDRYLWLRDSMKPLMGICAGMQFLGLVHGSTLVQSSEIGMKSIRSTEPTQLLPPSFEAYNLHNNSVISPESLKVVARSEQCVQAFLHDEKPHFGVLFHPEVRNPETIRRFLASYCTPD